MGLFGWLKRSDAEASQGESDLQKGKSVNDGLEQTRTGLLAKLRGIFTGGSKISPDLFDQLEEALISADVGAKTSSKIVNELKRSCDANPQFVEQDVKRELNRIIYDSLKKVEQSGIEVPFGHEGPFVIFISGVNGVGKTTTIAKLAAKFLVQGKRVLVAACDTFRAAAEEQLELWSQYVGFELEVAEGESVKPSTVAYRAVHRAIKEKIDVLIVDTAGRLHTRINLMKELEHLHTIVGRECEGSPHESILVLDATNGQNALYQAKEFKECVEVTGLILAKLDSTAKGGVILGISEELGIPIRYIGVGEQIGDLREFYADEFVSALLAD